jgi:hypothetical protein
MERIQSIKAHINRLRSETDAIMGKLKGLAATIDEPYRKKIKEIRMNIPEFDRIKLIIQDHFNSLSINAVASWVVRRTNPYNFGTRLDSLF